MDPSMWNDIGPRVLDALGKAAAEHFDADHALAIACRNRDLVRARALIDALPAPEADELLAAAHRRLREDPAALLAAWRPRGAPSS